MTVPVMEKLPQVANEYMMHQVVINAAERGKAGQEDSGPSGGRVIFCNGRRGLEDSRRPSGGEAGSRRSPGVSVVK